jgi:hypothetical protein
MVKKSRPLSSGSLQNVLLHGLRKVQMKFLAHSVAGEVNAMGN